jgi:hypothetical protein
MAQLRRLQLAPSARRPGAVFRPLPARFGASPAPLRLLLEPAADDRVSVTLLKRRGPLSATPLLLDLPLQPASARLRVRRPATVQGGAGGPPARVATGAAPRPIDPRPDGRPASPGLRGAHPLLPAAGPDGAASPLH